jgi:ATPase subunit of ABC transporter with duplicated ATPase domains
MLRFYSVSKQHGHQILFIDALMAVQKGEKVGLVGPNGAGKSIIFRLIAGQEQPDDGREFADVAMTFERVALGADTFVSFDKAAARPHNDQGRAARQLD